MKQQHESVTRESLVEEYLPYVRSIAGKLLKQVGKNVDIEELVGYGRIGLLEAADRFNPENGVKFRVFAYYRIKGAMIDGLWKFSWISRSQYSHLKHERHLDDYVSEHATSRIRAREPVSTVEELYGLIRGMVPICVLSLDAQNGLENRFHDGSVPDVECEHNERRKIVRKMLETLPDKDRELIAMCYYEDKSLKEAGEHFNLSKSWTSRWHWNVIRKLEKSLAQNGYTKETL